MKKSLRIFLLIFFTFVILIVGFVFYALCVTSAYSLDDDKLINLNQTIVFYDKNNVKISETSKGNEVTQIENVNEYTKKAFIAIEDKRFYEHKGVDFKRLISATLNNIKSFSFKEGASTISQQLIKNTHLSSEKTINRKLIEIKLAKDLERKYLKDEILEKYLNTIYFGENCYGITNASKLYFNKNVCDLSLNESAMLAALIKAPTNYSPFSNNEKCFKRKNLVLKAMKEQGFISNHQYENEILSMPDLCENECLENEYDYLYLVKNQLKNIKNSTPYNSFNLEVFTNYDENAQTILKNSIQNLSCDYLKSAVLLDKKGNICAYYSNCGNVNRQLGSIIKPVAIYAPAIEEDLVYPYSHIVDEKTDFNGYSPSNYNDVYHGKVTVKNSLEKSMNTCAVKILNYLGVDKAFSYASKLGLECSENDKSLCFALGCTEKGDKLASISSAYTVFLNEGKYCLPNTINYVKRNNDVILKGNEKKLNVYSPETVGFMNDMLKGVVENGTAKKLSFLDFPIYAKTGTVGNNKGNTDAYVISYNSEYVLGCWVGCFDDLMDNSITGGSLPTLMAYDIWSSLYKNKTPPKEIETCNNLIHVDVDKISYDEDDVYLLADMLAPEKYRETLLMKKSKAPLIYSKRFSEPKIEMPKISVNTDCFTIRLCLAKLYGVEIFKKYNGKKELLIDTNEKEEFVYNDYEILPNIIYEYSFMPYYKSTDGKKTYGQEIVLDKIKSPSISLGDWWNE